MKLMPTCFISVLFSLPWLLGSCVTELSAKDQPVMNDHIKTNVICAGRLFIDVPRSVKVKLIGSYRSIDVKQVGYVKEFAEIDEEVKRRADDLRAVKMKGKDDPDSVWNAHEKDQMIADSRLVGMGTYPDKSSSVIGFHEEDYNVGIVVELHKILDGTHFAFSMKSKGADKYSFARDRLIEAADRFAPLKPNEIPQRPGFCVDDGIFVDQGAPEANEEFTLVLEFPKHPDVRFSIESIAIDEPDDEEPLERRADRDLALMRENAGSVQVINRGKREAAGQRGYEIAISAPSDAVEGGRMRKFFWGAQGVPNDVSRPFLEVDMTISPTEKTGGTFADDAQAREFWDRILSSLRIRPGAK